MKLLLTFLVFASLVSCTKSDLIIEDASKSLGCISTSKASVKKELLNASSSEYFYYLIVDELINGSYSVYPDVLPQALQEDGRRIQIQYSASKAKYSFNQLSSGCNRGESSITNESPARPNTNEPQSMPMIQVCNASALL